MRMAKKLKQQVKEGNEHPGVKEVFYKNLHKKKAPHYCEAFKIGIDLLSHDQNRSTISASRLNFSVRNGKRWTVLL